MHTLRMLMICMPEVHSHKSNDDAPLAHTTRVKVSYSLHSTFSHKIFKTFAQIRKIDILKL